MATDTLDMDTLIDLTEQVRERTGLGVREVVVDADPILPAGCAWAYDQRLFLTPDVWSRLTAMAKKTARSDAERFMGIPVVEKRGALRETLADRLTRLSWPALPDIRSVTTRRPRPRR